MDGTSFSYTFEDPKAAERHTVQYFEMYGSRAIYQDGWWACSRLDKLPWEFSPATLGPFKPGSGYDPDQDPWELYYLPDDFSQAKKNWRLKNPRSWLSSRSSSGRRQSATGRARSLDLIPRNGYASLWRGNRNGCESIIVFPKGF
jgi:arylsulfatase A-like enzyme